MHLLFEFQQLELYLVIILCQGENQHFIHMDDECTKHVLYPMAFMSYLLTQTP